MWSPLIHCEISTVKFLVNLLKWENALFSEQALIYTSELTILSRCWHLSIFSRFIEDRDRCDFCLWGYLKRTVYHDNIRKLSKFKEAIHLCNRYIAANFFQVTELLRLKLVEINYRHYIEHLQLWLFFVKFVAMSIEVMHFYFQPSSVF